MSDNNNPFIPGPGVLLSMSTCAVIGEVVARELKATGGYSSTIDIIDRLDATREKLATADEVALILATTPRAVYDFARRVDDPLPVVKLGRVRRFRPSDVAAWIERQR